VFENWFDRFGRLGSSLRGRRYASSAAVPAVPGQPADNPLREYFKANRTGPGIWKWDHYFDAYHRHLQAFRGRSPRMAEVGIYSGGSLGMWADYFGPGCELIGVDIEPACKAYERPGVRVMIGDQADRAFWRRFRQEVPSLDILIDDGGHTSEQQIATLEEVLPYLAPGGIYICEDIHNMKNTFTEYAHGLIQQLNQAAMVNDHDDPERRLWSPSAGLQAQIEYIAVYPYMVVIQKRAAPLAEFVAAKHGTEWQPFLS
jgi:hypothetical protein